MDGDEVPFRENKLMSLKKIPEIKHWHQVTVSPVLVPGALHLWRIRTGDDGAALSRQRPLLSPREVERANRLRIRRHQARYVRAHAGLRAILTNYIDIEPQRIVFIYATAGKPLLDGASSNLHFNLTTSGDLAMVAISRGEPVGLDCEWVRERKDMGAIAKRMFSAEEASPIATAALEEERLMQFHLAWTSLEAGVKADGRGLGRHKEPAAQGTLDIRHCVPEHGYMAAVARRDLPPVRNWVTLELTPG